MIKGLRFSSSRVSIERERELGFLGSETLAQGFFEFRADNVL